MLATSAWITAGVPILCVMLAAGFAVIGALSKRMLDHLASIDESNKQLVTQNAVMKQALDWLMAMHDDEHPHRHEVQKVAAESNGPRRGGSGKPVRPAV